MSLSVLLKKVSSSLSVPVGEECVDGVGQGVDDGQGLEKQTPSSVTTEEKD